MGQLAISRFEQKQENLKRIYYEDHRQEPKLRRVESHGKPPTAPTLLTLKKRRTHRHQPYSICKAPQLPHRIPRHITAVTVRDHAYSLRLVSPQALVQIAEKPPTALHPGFVMVTPGPLNP